MSRIGTSWAVGAAVTALALAGAPTARAGLIPSSVSVSQSGGNNLFTYAITMESETKLEAGHFFTIYDFSGYVPNSATAPNGNWTVTVEGESPPSLATPPVDSAALPNITFTYTGPSLTTNAQQSLPLGNFVITSTLGGTASGYFTSLTKSSTNATLGSITFTDLPAPQDDPDPPDPPQAPEPGTLALLGLGLPVLGAYQYLRRRKGVIE